MKLLLTSDGFANKNIFDEFEKLVGKPAKEIKIAYIPTAANGEDEAPWVEEQKKNILNLGILKENLLILDLDDSPNYSILDKIDAVFIEGGNTFYLAKRFKDERFDSKLKDLLEKGIVYIGVSAGTVLAGKYIDIASPFDENKIGLKDFNGISLTDRIISPHYNSKEKSIINNYENRTGNKVLRLNDGEALLCIDREEKIIK